MTATLLTESIANPRITCVGNVRVNVSSGVFVRAPEASDLKFGRAGGSTVITSLSEKLGSLEI